MCAEAGSGAVVSYAYGIDGVPMPRCGYARLSQRIIVSNPTSAPIDVALSTGQRLRVPPAGTRAFPGTLKTLVRTPGRYHVRFSNGAAAELLVER